MSLADFTLRNPLTPLHSLPVHTGVLCALDCLGGFPATPLTFSPCMTIVSQGFVSMGPVSSTMQETAMRMCPCFPPLCLTTGNVSGGCCVLLQEGWDAVPADHEASHLIYVPHPAGRFLYALFAYGPSGRAILRRPDEDHPVFVEGSRPGAYACLGPGYFGSYEASLLPHRMTIAPWAGWGICAQDGLGRKGADSGTTSL